MRKAVAMPTLGMIFGFLVGLAIGYFYGIDFIQIGTTMASEFFLSLGIIVGTSFGIILLILLGIVFVKAWYFLVPFIIGLIIGVVLITILSSSLFTGITAGSFFTKFLSWREDHGPPSLAQFWEVVN